MDDTIYVGHEGRAERQSVEYEGCQEGRLTQSCPRTMSSGSGATEHAPSVDDSASELPPPPPKTPAPAPARPYEEERRILLNSVAESLAKVVGKMGTLNEQLRSTADSCREVEEVASVWRKALGDGGGDDNGDNNDDAMGEA